MSYAYKLVSGKLAPSGGHNSTVATVFTVAPHTIIKAPPISSNWSINNMCGFYVLVSESVCQVIVSVTLNIVGFALALAAIVLYINSVAETWLEWICDHDYSIETPWDKLFAQDCWEKTQSTDVSVT